MDVVDCDCDNNGDPGYNRGRLRVSERRRSWLASRYWVRVCGGWEVVFWRNWAATSLAVGVGVGVLVVKVRGVRGVLRGTWRGLGLGTGVLRIRGRDMVS